jgi:hypothetical protein
VDTLLSKIYESNPCFKGRIKRLDKVGRIGKREGEREGNKRSVALGQEISCGLMVHSPML